MALQTDDAWIAVGRPGYDGARHGSGDHWPSQVPQTLTCSKLEETLTDEQPVLAPTADSARRNSPSNTPV